MYSLNHSGFALTPYWIRGGCRGCAPLLSRHPLSKKCGSAEPAPHVHSQ